MKQIVGEKITLEGNTIEITDINNTEPYGTLELHGDLPQGDPVKIEYSLKSSTPQEKLEELFENDFSISPVRTTHRLVVSNEDIEVVYSNPTLK